eukprot:13350156-Alexandrium_andersonii.AAC.1
MSASLVGSEMCIRDSAKGDPLGTEGPAGGPRHAADRPSGEEDRRRLHAVSYTHLTLPTICSV